MHRQWYIGFGVVLLIILMFLVMIKSAIWFFALLIPIIMIGIYDVTQTKHTILRNFPVLGHIRFILEFFRPEIQQYFIANDEEERPFNREQRSLVYQRAKGERDTRPFGTDKDLMEIGFTGILQSLNPKHLSEVEPRIHVGGPSCTKPYCSSRLNISAMSFGALSANAIMALNQAAKIGEFAHNTGEGGLSPYHLQGGDIIFQIGTGYFGCRDKDGNFDPEEFKKEAHREEVKMIEIKLSQGAKPAHGGILPAAKLTEEIAKVRKVPMGKDVISPPAHTAFSTPKGLLEFVDHLRELSGGKPVGFKLCLGKHSEFLGICKAMVETGRLPDFITVDGAEGGTGAAPLEFSNRIGVPLEPALVFVHNSLVGINVRDKVKVICSGKVITGYDLVEKIALGADIVNSARGMMLSIGCIQSKQCDANTCPTGVATQNKRLQRGLNVDDKKIRAANYHKNTLKSFLEIVGAMGLSNPTELRPEFLLRHVGVGKVKALNEIYAYLEPGQLFTDDLPPRYKVNWEIASADHF